ncbi:MAG: hypothetical protein ACLQGP_32780 [Isosphaeraceae bacterium]
MSTPFESLVHGLVPFLEGLRSAGYRVETKQILAAHGLLATLAERGQVPDDLAALRTYLGPIVCASPREQEDFEDRFGAWVKTLSGGEPRGGPEADLASKLREVKKRGRAEGIRALPWLVAGGVLFVAVALSLTYFVVSQKSPEPRPPLTTPGEPVVDGAYKKERRPKSSVSGREEPGQAKNPGNTPQRFDFRANPTIWRRFQDLAGGVAVFAGVAFEVLGGLWLVKRFSRSWWDREAERFDREPGGGAMVLRRGSAGGAPRLTTLRIHPEDVWGAAARQRLSRAAVGLRRHLRVEADAARIDVAATLDRALRVPDLTGPITARVQVTPEHLALVDRVSLRDHQADWADALLDRLSAEQVALVRFEYSGDPRACYPRRGPGPPWSLRELSARYPGHRLLVFTDGEALLDPLTGRAASWLDQFASWEVRCAITPIPRENWGGREAELEASGFLVEPATTQGLEALAGRIAAAGGSPRSEPPTDGAEPVPPMPRALRSDPLRWLESTPPPVDELRRLMRDLRWYLQEDFDWLAACAVYPELRWDLTLELGRVLAAADGRARPSLGGLSRLSRLPWFRHGSMPDWLRLCLLHGLDPGRRAKVLDALGQLLLGATRVEVGAWETGPSLVIAGADGDGGTLGALARGVRRRLAKEEPDGPLNDQVFATFLEGREPGPLDVGLHPSVGALLEAGTRPTSYGVRTRASRRSLFDYLVVLPALVVYNCSWVSAYLAVFMISIIIDYLSINEKNVLYFLIFTIVIVLYVVLLWAFSSARAQLRRVALNKPLTTLGLASVMIWHAVIVSMALCGTAMIVEHLLSLSNWRFAGSGSVLWFLCCVALVTLLFRLYARWRIDRVQTSLRFFRAPLRWHWLNFFMALLLSPTTATAGDAGMVEFSFGMSMVGLFIAMGPWFTMLKLTRWERFEFPKPTPRPRFRVADAIPWGHANLRTLVILTGVVAAVTLLPWIISWWSGGKSLLE